MGGSEADLRRELLRHLEVIFATEVLPRKEADANDDRHLLACLRSYAALGEARAAHSLFARLVISPILSNMLTPGQVVRPPVAAWRPAFHSRSHYTPAQGKVHESLGRMPKAKYPH